MIKTERIYVKDLNANDPFVVPGHHTVYVCEARQNMDNQTSVTYRVLGSDVRSRWVTPSLSTVDRLDSTPSI